MSLAEPLQGTRVNALSVYRKAVQAATLHQRIGWVRQLQGLAIESQGPDAAVGELCEIELIHGAQTSNLVAEVVGIKQDRVILMPFGSSQGVSAGCKVVAVGRRATVDVGPALLGRVIDGFCTPLDNRPAPQLSHSRPLIPPPANPLSRPRIRHVLETGVRSIDSLLTMGQGQRMGIFAGSGVGKSTLLGMIARHVRADVNVVALIGERGREVAEFIEKQLGPEGLARTVVVVATSDQPALARIRAAYAAVAIAEYFRDQGKQVVLTMDSITRLAMARREVGLSAGEPPTARGYTPSVFAELAPLCERCGTSESGGSITALMTVLVDGDDFNEPISDSMRSILDGHIVLSRHLAQQGHYPAVDVLKSASRLLPDLTTQGDRVLISATLKQLALLERNRSMVEIGAYERGSSPSLDRALAIEDAMNNWLQQSEGGTPRNEALTHLASVHKHASRALPNHGGTPS